MNKLLSANFARIWKNRAFQIAALLMVAMGIIFPVTAYEDMKRNGYIYTLDERFFCFAALIGVILAVCCSLFVGTEYSDGTIRNKLVVGHTRIAVYLSNLAVCAAAGILLCAVSMAVAAVVGIPLLGFFQGGAKTILLFSLCTFAGAMAYTALYIWISMVCSSKAVAAVICILCAFFLIFFSTYINSALQEPETWPAYVYASESGAMEEDSEMPNPSYVSGRRREVYEFLNDFLPTGQSINILQGTLETPGRCIAYDGIIFLAATGAGMLVFKRKNIK